MTAWEKDELEKIGTYEEIQLASMRLDGTLRKAVTIWVVRVKDELYIRSVNGRSGTWFRWTQERHAGRLRAGTVERDVSFVDAELAINDQVDAAYRTKYRRYSAGIVNSVLTPQARASTIRLAPRTTDIR